MINSNTQINKKPQNSRFEFLKSNTQIKTLSKTHKKFKYSNQYLNAQNKISISEEKEEGEYLNTQKKKKIVSIETKSQRKKWKEKEKKTSLQAWIRDHHG